MYFPAWKFKAPEGTIFMPNVNVVDFMVGGAVAIVKPARWWWTSPSKVTKSSLESLIWKPTLCHLSADGQSYFRKGKICCFWQKKSASQLFSRVWWVFLCVSTCCYFGPSLQLICHSASHLRSATKIAATITSVLWFSRWWCFFRNRPTSCSKRL